MLTRLDHTRLLRYAGLFTWALVGLPLLYTAQFPPEALDDSQPPSMAWQGWVAYAAFGVLYLWLTRTMGGRRTRLANYALLPVFLGAALAMSYYSLSGLGSILLMVAACVLPWLLPLPVSIAVLVLSELVVVPVYMRAIGFSLVEGVMQSLL